MYNIILSLDIKKTKKLTARETAHKLTEITMEHLSTLTPKEREKRIKAFQAIVAETASLYEKG